MVKKLKQFFLFLMGLIMDIQVDLNAQSFTKESVENALKTEILQKIQNANFTVALHTWNPKWEDLKSDDGIITISQLVMTDQNQKFKATVDYKGTQKIVLGQVVRKITLPVLEQPLNGHDTFEHAVFSFQDFEETQLTGDIILKEEDLKGMKVRTGRVIKANTPIRRCDIEKPIVIKRGDQVRLYYVDPSFEISTIAFAKANGAVGDKITFEVGIGSSKKVVQALIVHEGRVEIRDAL